MIKISVHIASALALSFLILVLPACTETAGNVQNSAEENSATFEPKELELAMVERTDLPQMPCCTYLYADTLAVDWGIFVKLDGKSNVGESGNAEIAHAIINADVHYRRYDTTEWIDINSHLHAREFCQDADQIDWRGDIHCLVPVPTDSSTYRMWSRSEDSNGQGPPMKKRSAINENDELAGDRTIAQFRQIHPDFRSYVFSLNTTENGLGLLGEPIVLWPDAWLKDLIEGGGTIKFSILQEEDIPITAMMEVPATSGI